MKRKPHLILLQFPLLELFQITITFKRHVLYLGSLCSFTSGPRVETVGYFSLRLVTSYSLLSQHEGIKDLYSNFKCLFSSCYSLLVNIHHNSTLAYAFWGCQPVVLRLQLYKLFSAMSRNTKINTQIIKQIIVVQLVKIMVLICHILPEMSKKFRVSCYFPKSVTKYSAFFYQLRILKWAHKIPLFFLEKFP